MLTVVLDTMDKFPGLFAALAARDHGEDDKVLETGPGYAIIKANEAVAPEVRKSAAGAITYYANLSRRKKKPVEK